MMNPLTRMSLESVSKKLEQLLVSDLNLKYLVH